MISNCGIVSLLFFKLILQKWKGVGFEPTYSLRDPGLQQTPLTLSIFK